VPRSEGHDELVDRVAAVCYRLTNGQVQFLLVRTKGGTHWTFPKGHVERGETPWRAAQREALEEAGVRGRMETKPLMTFPHEQRASDGRLAELTVAAYLLHVESESDAPEPGRDPTWFSPDRAKQKLAEGRGARYQQAFGQVVDEAYKRLGGKGAANPPEEE
jgi:8-oxo-dGTP pyrophosphatase MutT (NUDIX family)